MKKQLSTDAIKNELAGSVFFPRSQEQQHNQETQKADTVIPRHHDTMISRHHEPVVSDAETELIEAIRKAVKPFGKEGATLRCTTEERQALADLEYTYKRQGIRTSGNEITRIGINYIVEDFRKNGEQSILAKVLKRLNS